MKKLIIFALMLGITTNSALAQELSIKELNQKGIVANSPIEQSQLKKAEKILSKVQKETEKGVKNGKGPFFAIIYDEKGKVIAKSSNSVIEEQCALNHAEVNTIRKASEKLKTYDLAPYNLSIYINAEPCIMCAGAIMWSGIKTVYYGVSSKDVEEITGFDEGYKPNWQTEFKKRGITVYGNIGTEEGKKVLYNYVKSGKKVYKPSR